MADAPKARGRSRGRARGQQPSEQQTRRPGQERPVPEVADVRPGSNNGGGRRTHRGAPRTDPLPSTSQEGTMQAQQIEQSMAAMGIEGSGRGRSRIIPDENTRPAHVQDKKGETGTGIPLVANFFEVVSKPAWAVYQYHVEFAPLVESSFLRRVFMREHRETFGDAFLFDGMSDLKTLKKLGPDTELFSKRNSDNETIRITLKFITELAPSHPELGRLFNTQMKRNLSHLKYQLLGRHYYDQQSVSEMPQFNMQVWQGVTTSIRQQEEKLMMSVDTVFKVIRKDTVLQILTQAATHQGERYRENVTRELVGSVVMTRYNNRTYTVEDIDWSLNPSKTFDSREGPISYIAYYKKHYDIDIRSERQPLLLCKSKEREIRENASMLKKIYLVPELCVMTGITDAMRSDFTLMRELANQMRLEPTVRVKNLQTFIKRLNSNETVQKEMNNWDIAFSNNLVRFSGRVLAGESIQLGRNLASYNQASGDFFKEIRGKPMHCAKPLDNWILICTKYDELKAQDFLSNLRRVCPPMGMAVKDPILIVIQEARITQYIQAFRDGFNSSTQLVCFILPNNEKLRYDALKKLTCLENAVPSQVIVSRTLNKKQTIMSVATKIGIQMNCKIGGEPWAVVIPLSKPIMIIGYDTYHDSDKRGRSAGAFIASLNQSLTRWYSKVTFHSAGGWEELSNHVENNFKAALYKYKEVNKCLPDYIIYYRDGVGDGQIRYVLEMEVKPFKNVIKELLGDRETKFAFIVVNKKVNARFFAERQNGYFNPPPGTVIDHTVTRFDRYDFFLVSQSVRQGTVAPTMYNVIEDTTGLKPEHMQKLSYKLTHLYYNWPGTIRVPAPCQFAHKLAFLAGQSLHETPHENLCETLFYL